MARLFLILSSGIQIQIVVLTNRFPYSSHASGPRTDRHLALSNPGDAVSLLALILLINMLHWLSKKSCIATQAWLDCHGDYSFPSFEAFTPQTHQPFSGPLTPQHVPALQQLMFCCGSPLPCLNLIRRSVPRTGAPIFDGHKSCVDLRRHALAASSAPGINMMQVPA